ncbi:MAG: hypothetical protein HXY44_17590 [Syntrophaceae bacterium]|nr:hypothetical protein [Syntrophaceae bacterium]
MAVIALVLSLFIAGLGALGIISPIRLLRIVRQFQSTSGLYIAAGFRILLGVVLLLSTSNSRFPEVVLILGAIIFVSGLITPLLGLERFRRLLNWWSGLDRVFMRIWGGFAFVFGLFLAYAVSP